jgi:hypothetical protein
MLKLISSRSGVYAKRQRRTASAREETRMLYQRIDEARAVVECTQRDVARGRRSIVESHARVVGCQARPLESTAAPATVTGRVATLASFASRIDEIHRRLLMFSSSIEMEMDCLDVVRAEIDQLTADERSRGGSK